MTWPGPGPARLARDSLSDRDNRHVATDSGRCRQRPGPRLLTDSRVTLYCQWSAGESLGTVANRDDRDGRRPRPRRQRLKLRLARAETMTAAAAAGRPVKLP